MPFADVGPAIIPDWMDDEDALLCTDALATRYFGAQLADTAEGGRVRRGPNWAVRREVGLADERRPRPRDRLFGEPSRQSPHLRARRELQLHGVRRHRGDDEKGDGLPRRRLGDRLRRRRGRPELPATRHRRETQIAGRISDRAELGHRLTPQGRDGVGWATTDQCSARSNSATQ